MKVKDESTQMAPAAIESQENEPHPVFQQQAAQSLFATLNETASPETNATLSTSTTAQRSV